MCACVCCMCNLTLLGPKARFLRFLLELDCAAAAASVLPSAPDSTRTTTPERIGNDTREVSLDMDLPGRDWAALPVRPSGT